MPYEYLKYKNIGVSNMNWRLKTLINLHEAFDNISQPIHTVTMPVTTVTYEWTDSTEPLYFKTLRVSQLIIKFCAFCMEPENSLPCLKTGTYTTRDETLHTHFLYI